MSQDPLIQEREKEQRRVNRWNRTRAKAEAYFNIYYDLGAERSLVKLHDYLGAIGVRISKNTLENYSRNFNWQIELAKRDTQLAEQKRQRQLDSVAEMEQRHIEMAQTTQRILTSGLKHYLDAIASGEPKQLPIDIITRSLKDAIAIERTARGEPTERRELQIQIDNVWILAVTQIFLAINDYPDSKLRLEEFGNRLQQFVDNRAAEIA